MILKGCVTKFVADMRQTWRSIEKGRFKQAFDTSTKPKVLEVPDQNIQASLDHHNLNYYWLFVWIRQCLWVWGNPGVPKRCNLHFERSISLENLHSMIEAQE